jgi:hypothetical protein
VGVRSVVRNEEDFPCKYFRSVVSSLFSLSEEQGGVLLWCCGWLALAAALLPLACLRFAFRWRELPVVPLEACSSVTEDLSSSSAWPGEAPKSGEFRVCEGPPPPPSLVLSGRRVVRFMRLGTPLPRLVACACFCLLGVLAGCGFGVAGCDVVACCCYALAPRSFISAITGRMPGGYSARLSSTGRRKSATIAPRLRLLSQWGVFFISLRYPHNSLP